MKNKRLTKFISAAVCASVVLTAGSTTLAAQRKNNLDSSLNSEKNVTSSNLANEKTGPRKGAGKCGRLRSILTEMVKEGTLTQKEADKITAYKKEKEKSIQEEMEKVKNMTEEERKVYFTNKKTEGQNLLSELVSKGIITQAKADLIKAKMEQRAQEMKTARLNEIKSQLKTLVTKGTINQAQADKVLDYMNQVQGKVRIEKGKLDETEKDKIRNMTEEERKAYFEKIRGEKGSFLKELVDNGTLTQEQVNEISKVIRHQTGKGIKGK